MQVCLDYLAGAHYESEILSAHTPGVGAGFLYRPFKDPINVAAKMAAKGGIYCPLIRIHGEFQYDHTFENASAIIDYTVRANSLALKYPGTQFFYSPRCEPISSRAQALEIMLACSRRVTAGNLRLVNGVYRGPSLPGVIDEVHGAKVRAPDGEFWFKSADGVGGNLIRRPDVYDPRWVDIDVPAWMDGGPNLAAAFGWNFRFNLKYGPKDKTPVEKRKLKPSVEYIKGHTRLLFPIGGKQELKKGVTWKAFADDHGKGDKKDNKALVIIPDKHSSVSLYDVRGREISKAKYYGTFEGGGYRYYFPEWAYQLAAEALRKSGSEFCTIRAGRANYGRVNPAFRGKPK